MTSEEAGHNLKLIAINDFLPVAFIASTICILVDVFALPRVEFQRAIYSVPWVQDVVRVLLLPVSLVIGRSVAVVAAFVKPRQVDARFQNELKGMNSLWAALGFFVALYFLFSRASDQGLEDRVSLWQGTESKLAVLDDRVRPLPNTIEGMLGAVERGISPTPKAVIYSGSNYEQYSDLITEYAEKYDIKTDIFFALVAEESNFNPQFIGVGGGVGFLNVTPSMAQQVGIEHHLTPAGNLEAGARVLRSLIDLFGEKRPRLWIAAYHFGTKRIQDNPQLVEQDPDIKGFVDAVMRKVDAS